MCLIGVWKVLTGHAYAREWYLRRWEAAVATSVGFDPASVECRALVPLTSPLLPLASTPSSVGAAGGSGPLDGSGMCSVNPVNLKESSPKVSQFSSPSHALSPPWSSCTLSVIVVTLSYRTPARGLRLELVTTCCSSELTSPQYALATPLNPLSTARASRYQYAMSPSLHFI